MIYSLIPLFFLGLRDIKYKKVKIWHVLVFVAFAILDLITANYSIGIILSGLFISYILVKLKVIQRVDAFILFIMALILGPLVFSVVFLVHFVKSLIFKILHITEDRTSFLDSVFFGSVIVCLSCL